MKRIPKKVLDMKLKGKYTGRKLYQDGNRRLEIFHMEGMNNMEIYCGVVVSQERNRGA
jgi:hypothetical protein